MPVFRRPTPGILGLARALAPAGLSIAVALALSGAASAPKAPARHASHMNMNDAEMQKLSDAYWATHARVGTPSLAPPAVTVHVGNFFFDADGNTSNGPDTVRIEVGETVQWKWLVGTHSVTNGTEQYLR